MSRLKYLEKLTLYINTENITKASIELFESMSNLREVDMRKYTSKYKNAPSEDKSMINYGKHYYLTIKK